MNPDVRESPVFLPASIILLIHDETLHASRSLFELTCFEMRYHLCAETMFGARTRRAQLCLYIHLHDTRIDQYVAFYVSRYVRNGGAQADE